MSGWGRRRNDNRPYKKRIRTSYFLVGIKGKVKPVSGKVVKGDNYSGRFSDKKIREIIKSRINRMARKQPKIVYDNLFDIKHKTVTFWGIVNGKIVDSFKIKENDNNTFSMRNLQVKQ